MVFLFHSTESGDKAGPSSLGEVRDDLAALSDRGHGLLGAAEGILPESLGSFGDLQGLIGQAESLVEDGMARVGEIGSHGKTIGDDVHAVHEGFNEVGDAVSAFRKLFDGKPEVEKLPELGKVLDMFVRALKGLVEGLMNLVRDIGSSLGSQAPR